MATKKYYVNGMHCPACEINIERVVKKIKGISKVEVSLQKSQLIVTSEKSGDLPSAHKLNSHLSKYGYEVNDLRKDVDSTKKNQNFIIVGLFFVVFILLFLFIGGTNFISGIYVDPAASTSSFFIFGIAAGISSCAALVGGLLLTVQNSWLKNPDLENGKRYLPFVLFNASRILAFAILGGFLGLLGSAIKISIFGSAILTTIIAIFMVFVGFQMLGVKSLKGITLNPFGKVFTTGLNKSNSKSMFYPVFLGAITFFIPCGYTIIAQTQAIGSGSFRSGFLSLGAFALGTLPTLILISFTSIKFHNNPKFSNAFQLFSGLMIVFFALFTINGQFGLLGLPNLVISQNQDTPITIGENQLSEVIPETPSVNMNQEFQIMKMEVQGFEYFPKVIQIKSGVPTRFEITDNGSVGCARAVYARGIYAEVINLQPGLNSVEFMSPAPGSYQISCSMWMVNPITVIIE